MSTNTNKRKISLLLVLIISTFSLGTVKTAHSSSQESKPGWSFYDVALASIYSLAGGVAYLNSQTIRFELLLKSLKADFRKQFMETDDKPMQFFLKRTNLERLFKPLGPPDYHDLSITLGIVTIIDSFFGSKFPQFLEKWIKKFAKLTYTEKSYWFMKNFVVYPAHDEATDVIRALYSAKKYATQVVNNMKKAQANNLPLRYEYNYFRRIRLLTPKAVFLGELIRLSI